MYEADRGAHQNVQFQRCVRGFLISTGDRMSGYMGALYAFDRIEDVAAWFVEQYRDIPDDGKGNPEKDA